MAAVVAEQESILAELDPDRLGGDDAAALYASFAASERLTVAGKTLLAPRVEQSGVWKNEGHRDAATHLASLEGVSTGQARGTLVNGRRLRELPATEAVVRGGGLSTPKLTELCGAAVLDPDRESELVERAADQPLSEVRERCRRSRAASAAKDPVATAERIHRDRHFIWWTDAEGAFCYKGRDTADRGARILHHLGHAADCLHRARTAHADRTGVSGATSSTSTSSSAGTDGPTGPSGTRTVSPPALWADAFFALVTQQTVVEPASEPDPGAGESGHAGTGESPARGTARSRGAAGSPDPHGSDPRGSTDRSGTTDPRPPPSSEALAVITRPPTCTTLLRVDLDVLRRGVVGPGEVCEIDGQGPIPVPMAEALITDSQLSLLFHQAGDIRGVSHQGRTINAALRTALVYRDRHCVVPGCGISVGLEIDHIRQFHLGGPTELENLALLCYHHHQLKTHGGWTLTRLGVDREGRTGWSFEPQPAFGQEPDLGIDTDEGRRQWRLRRE